ncbi:MAG TPA: glycosyltransferase [Candidatus Bipolaricaulis sp.]|nr:glycosyltransferase [Candidatus Bipolaricaulis sp.]HRS13710.1 glycosyltransferase [Candidatus Bipolaricaulis sp.]HRU21582.1 glycosyltransferase [Candidatus Bipolaricaulis sp.]
MIRIGFLMSDTGGGHRAAGRAIEAALHHLDPGTFECEYFDVFRRCGLPPFRWAPEIYPWWVAHHQPSYDFFVSQTDRLLATRLGRRGLPSWVLRKGPCLKALASWQAMVVLHAGFSGYAVAVRRAAKREIPLLTVITDLASPHSGWFHPDVDRCLVPTPSAIERGLKLGLAQDKLRLVGHPAHPKFALLTQTKAEARDELGWDQDLPTALVVSGAEGMGAMEELARSLDGLGAQLAIVAGRNEALAAKLRAIPWQDPIHIYGFVTNMETLMRGADVLIGKPGPGVIAEAAIMSLPMILTGGMVNERANVQFVTEAGAGVYAKTPEEVRATLADWISSPDELARRREATKKIAYPNASLEIAHEIAALARAAGTGPA